MNEEIEERAAIKEYDGNMTRAEAERQTKAEMSRCCSTCKHGWKEESPCNKCKSDTMSRWEKK